MGSGRGVAIILGVLVAVGAAWALFGRSKGAHRFEDTPSDVTQEQRQAPAQISANANVAEVVVSKRDTTPSGAAPAAKMSEYELQKEIERRFDSSYKEEKGKEDTAAREDFFKFVHKNFDLRPDQEEQVRKLEAEMNEELERAGNEAQKDRVIQEYASRLIPILGVPNP